MRRLHTIRSISTLLRLLVLIALTHVPCMGQTAPLLTSVGQVRELTPAQAEEARPVLLHGVVTVLSGWRTSFFLQGPDFGISVNRNDVSPEVEAGDEVEIHGHTNSGMFAPVVATEHTVILRKHVLPPAKLMTAAELAHGREDSQWIAIRGTIRSAAVLPRWGRSFLFLKIDLGGGTQIEGSVRDYEQADFASLAGAEVSVRGVCGTIFNDRRQFVGLRLFIAGLDEVHIEQPAPVAPFDLPVRPLGELLQFDSRPGATHQVRVLGSVTSPKPGIGFYLQDTTGGAVVHTTQTDLPAVGAKVEAIGYPAVGHYSPKLEDAFFRVVGSSAPPSPVAQDAAHMIVTKEGFTSAPLDAMLVRVRGKLIEKVPKADETLLILQDDVVIFAAHLPRTTGKLDAIRVGSVLSVTGICIADEDDFHEINSFDLLLRTPADLVVLQAPPWWTPTHALWVVALLLVALFIILGWLILARRQHSLRELAVTDALTGLYNRRGFLLLAQEQWQRALRRRVSLLLFYIDVDRFKEINDTFGHLEGDLALRMVGKVLQETFRQADILGRLGGDEFAVAAIDASEESAELLKKRIETGLQHYNLDGRQFRDLTLSIGVLVCEPSLGPIPIEEIIKRADTMMYEQKRRRKTAKATHRTPPALESADPDPAVPPVPFGPIGQEETEEALKR